MGNPQKSRREPVIEHENMTNSSMREGVQSSHKEANTKLDTCDGHDTCDEHGAISRLDAASYIHDMAIELKALADTANFSYLAYLFELAIEESSAQKRGRL
jgi:hypothetical protein